MELLYDVCELILFPLLIALGAYAVKLINSKAEQIKDKHGNEKLDKYIDMLNQTVSDCVLATTQTYVETLKKEGQFTAEANKKAFEMTFNNVMAILSDDAKDYLNTAVGDLDSYVTSKIEATVKASK